MEESDGGMPELPQSPISSPRGPQGPASADSSFLVLPGKGVGGDEGALCPGGPQYTDNMVVERSR
eukprot:3379934-Karenia_brevis.AAC.1